MIQASNRVVRAVMLNAVVESTTAQPWTDNARKKSIYIFVVRGDCRMNGKPVNILLNRVNDVNVKAAKHHVALS